MVLELTTVKIIQIVFGFIMAFSFGMKCRVSDSTRDMAGVVWVISMLFVWLLNLK